MSNTKHLIPLMLICLGCFLQRTDGEVSFKFQPSGRFRVQLYQSAELTVTFVSNETFSRAMLSFNCSSADEGIATAEALGNKSVELGQHSDDHTFHCLISSVKLGKTNITSTVTLVSEDGSLTKSFDSAAGYLEAVIVQPNTIWNDVVQFGMLAALALNSVAFGLKIDWSEVKAFLKKPCGIFLAVGCQYALLPAIAYLVGLVLGLEAHIKVALLAIACVPGGLPSNAITLALKGDINLSIVLTAIGNMGAFVMTPLWMYTLGQKLLSEQFPTLVIRLPWVIFCIFIAILTVPTIVGIAVGVRHPKIAPKLAYGLRIVGVSSALALIGIMIWVYRWAFEYLNNWKIVVAGILVPYVAMLISFLLSIVLLRSLKYAITIMIETSVQNISFSFFLIKAAIPEPESSLATKIPAIIVLCTYIPLLCVTLGKVIYEMASTRCQEEEEEEVDSVGSVKFVSSVKLGEPSVVIVNDDLNDIKLDIKQNGSAHVPDSKARF